MSSDIIKRLSTSRAALVLDHPFFGSLALKLKLIEDASKTDTMATDGRAIFYAPEFVAECTDPELVGVFAHEVLHPAMQHHTRRGERDPERWNHACDYAINPILKDSGFTLPEGALLDPAYAGMTAEQIYARLPESQGDGGPGGNEPMRAQPGGVLDAPEPAQDEAEWKVNVTQAAKAAQMMGGLPEAIARAIEEAVKPRTEWKALLRRFVQQSNAADYSWKLPNRRYLGAGLYLPELRSESMPPIVIAVDTSGSIDDKLLAEFAAEANAIVDECAPQCVHVIYCDAEVHGCETFERGERIELHAVGGGSTNFCPVFDHVDREQLAPACLIYLTDGMGKYPDSPSDYPTLWAMTNDRVAPWGETVRIEEVTS
jgi:predicted metal-dependent peptidase